MSRKLNIYFIHGKWLADREKVITEFQKLVTKYSFKNIKTVKVRTITDYDPSDINSDIIGKFVSYEQNKDEDPTVADDKKLSFYNNLMKNLHIFQLSNALKHYKALQEISQDNTADDDINIILEDDILYEDKICMTLDKLFTELDKSYGIVFLGLPSNIDMKKREGIKYQNTKEVFRILPYCDSYIISTAAAKILYENYLPIKYINNIQLSYVIEKTNINSVIALPNLFMDGSKFGLFLSVLNPNNALLFNNDYMKIKMLLSKESISDDEKKDIEKTLKESMVISHPDMMALNALYQIQNKNYKEAETIFENALKIYQGYNCILNHESGFLKDYIRLYKYLQ